MKISSSVSFPVPAVPGRFGEKSLVVAFELVGGDFALVEADFRRFRVEFGFEFLPRRLFVPPDVVGTC